MTKKYSEFEKLVVKLLNEADSGVKSSYFFHGEANDAYDESSYWDGVAEFNEILQSHGINFEQKERFGGEGQGDDYYSVYHFFTKTDECYIEFSGWYQSYNGAGCFDIPPLYTTSLISAWSMSETMSCTSILFPGPPVGRASITSVHGTPLLS